MKFGLTAGSLSQHCFISWIYLLSHSSKSFGISGLNGGERVSRSLTKTSDRNKAKQIPYDISIFLQDDTNWVLACRTGVIFFAFSVEHRQARGEREVRVTRDGKTERARKVIFL